MPLIRVENYTTKATPDSFEKTANLRGMLSALRQACVDAQVPGIDSLDKVTAVLGGHRTFEEDGTLIIVVEGLFDRPDRTKEVRDHLAVLLAQAAGRFEHLSSKIEVLINRFNPEVDSYFEVLPEDRR